MATRPVFIPVDEGLRLVRERNFDFLWAPGFAETQKKKMSTPSTKPPGGAGLDDLLEISTKSDLELGRRLSAFSLKLDVGGRKYPLESVYQSAKAFRRSGPFPEVMEMFPRDAKKFIREHAEGDLIGFRLSGEDFPLIPKNAFYDWLYIRSLADHGDWIRDKVRFSGFTDIEFNPQKQINCQARAFAEFLSLQRRCLLERAARDFNFFASLLNPI